MSRFRRPQQTFISGLGMAGAVLAAVVVAFTVASGIIAYSLTSEDPVTTTSSAALVLGLRAAGGADAPLVLHAHRVAGAAHRAAAAPGQLRSGGAAAEVRGAAAGELSASSGTQSSSGGAPNGASSGPADASGAEQSGKVPVGKALDQTTQAVGATTNTLGRRLQGASDDVAAGLSPATQQTGALLETIAQRTRAALDRLLHSHQ